MARSLTAGISLPRAEAAQIQTNHGADRRRRHGPQSFEHRSSPASRSISASGGVGPAWRAAVRALRRKLWLLTPLIPTFSTNLVMGLWASLMLRFPAQQGDPYHPHVAHQHQHHQGGIAWAGRLTAPERAGRSLRRAQPPQSACCDSSEIATSISFLRRWTWGGQGITTLQRLAIFKARAWKSFRQAWAAWKWPPRAPSAGVSMNIGFRASWAKGIRLR